MSYFTPNTPEKRAAENIKKFRSDTASKSDCLERAWILGERNIENYKLLINRCFKAKRPDRLVTYTTDEVFRLTQAGDPKTLADVIHFGQFAFLRANCKIHNDVIDHAIETLYATERRKADKQTPEKIGYLVAFENDKSSTLPTIPVRMAKHQSKKFKPVIFLIHDLKTIALKNPKAFEVYDDAMNQGIEFVECGLSLNASVFEVVETLSRKINESGLDVLVTHLQIGLYRMITAKCDAPLKIGIDHGHPEWYTSKSLDLSLAASPHNLEEALCPCLQIPRILPDLDQRKTMKPVEKNKDILKELQIDETSFVFLSSGSVVKFQDARFWQIVREVLKLPNVVWVFIGPEPDLLRGQFTPAEMQKCRFTGFRQDFPEVLSISDLYVDSFPVGGGEALARAAYLGKPIVTHIAPINDIFDKTKSYSAKADLFESSPLTIKTQDPTIYLKSIVEGYKSAELRDKAVREQKSVIQNTNDYKERMHEINKIITQMYNME